MGVRAAIYRIYYSAKKQRASLERDFLNRALQTLALTPTQLRKFNSDTIPVSLCLHFYPGWLLFITSYMDVGI